MPTTIEFSNGTVVPMIGLGTWRSPPEVVTRAVKDAIDIGYRHFDCAHIYGNEKEVGIAIEEKIAEGVITREDIFVTSKLWNTFHRPYMVRQACETSLKNLRLSYIDNYLIHWPMAFKDGEDLYPRDANNKTIFSDVDYLDTWFAMEELVNAGLVRTIGISNFNEQQIERLLSKARILPVNLQIESHPYLNQRPLMEFCRRHKIAVIAYSALGSAHTPYIKPGSYKVLEHPVVLKIAKKHKRNAAQILIRYQTQRGNLVIPRSVNKEHMRSNLNADDFEMTESEIAELDNLDINGRIITMENGIGHPDYPFERDDI